MPPGGPTVDPVQPHRIFKLVQPSDAEPAAARLVSVADPAVAQLASELYGAKPEVWRGRSDLPQVTWARTTKGCWLVLDLWSGIGGLPMVLLQAGWHFYCLSAEMDSEAVAVAEGAMPNLVHVSKVEYITVEVLLPFIRRRRPRGILLGGGSPCQANSALNRNRRGLQDPRSQQPKHLGDLRDSIQQHPECEDLEIVTFLENVGSMQEEVRQQYTAWLGAPPIMVDAAGCGWVHRRRLFWLVSKRGGIEQDFYLPDDWAWVPSSGGGPPGVQWIGKKPLPPKLFIQNGFSLMLDPQDVLKTKGAGAMHTFTREFFHPTDRVSSVSAAAAARFYQDYQRFPPGAYEEPSLAWKGSTWRTLYPEERAQIMGIPPEIFRVVPGPAAVRTQKANSFIGNGFHLFSVLLVVSLLPQLLAEKLPSSLVTCDEAALWERCRHTVWEPGRLAVFPGLFDVHEIIHGVRHCFPDCPVDEAVWAQVQLNLQSCHLPELQIFTAWCHLKQLPWHVLGPVPILRKDRAMLYAGLSGQRYPADSSKGLDHLLPPGLGKLRHLDQSRSLPSPFSVTPWPDHDVQFVVETIAVWRQFLPRWAEAQRHYLQTLARALRPLDLALQRHRVPSSQQVAADKHPAFVACMSVLLRWPDLQQAQQIVKGYPIVGEFSPTGVFRPVLSSGTLSVDQWLAEGPAAIARILASKPPLHADKILQVTKEEQDKGFCSRFFTKEEMDAQFGPDNWRPLERFLITQPCGKQRVIDNARKTQHNQATMMSETIYTVHLDFIAAVAADLSTKLGLGAPAWESSDLDWFHLRLGTDDLPDAYRALPVEPAQQGFSVIAIFVPGEGWRFTLLYGLAFGLESAVISFNRWPQLAIAIARRCTSSLTASYFDDEMAL